MRHEFGGLWTQKKLYVLEQYLEFYTTALKNQPFILHYADAFAGTGTQDPKVANSQGELIPLEGFNGSVRTALSATPCFHQYHFNDLNPDYICELEKIRDENPDKKIYVSRCDANDFVPKFCKSMNYNDRAVLLLDPYNTELDWHTLKHVADSQKVDLWLLFPISVIFRLTPRDGAKIRPEWRKTLNRLLGTDDWESALYEVKEEPVIDDLFSSSDPNTPYERLNVMELKAWVLGRLRELFSYVAEPVTLTNNNSPLFLFFFAVSNPDKKAWGLADRAATHIIKSQI